MTAPNAQARLDALAEEIRAHRGCGFDACETCLNPVPGEGPAEAAVMIVGEAPGEQEDKAGRPFVGGAGRMLDRLLARAGLERSKVFITNVLKARPPGNRSPRVAEVKHSLPWLVSELEIVAPRLVIPMGRHALVPFAADLKISEVHGTAIERDGRLLFPMYHPAAALHREELRETVYADAERLRSALATLADR
jgi:uracil-DNA glycosylase family 4